LFIINQGGFAALARVSWPEGAAEGGGAKHGAQRTPQDSDGAQRRNAQKIILKSI
jgi:hypothetical protein